MIASWIAPLILRPHRPARVAKKCVFVCVCVCAQGARQAARGARQAAQAARQYAQGARQYAQGARKSTGNVD
jgi:hypothetical protein